MFTAVPPWLDDAILEVGRADQTSLQGRGRDVVSAAPVLPPCVPLPAVAIVRASAAGC